MNYNQEGYSRNNTELTTFDPFDENQFNNYTNVNKDFEQQGVVNYQNVSQQNPEDYLYSSQTNLPVQFYQNEISASDIPSTRRYSDAEFGQVAPEAKKRQHFHVDSFYDNIPVVSEASGEPLGDLDDFFNEFHRKTSVGDHIEPAQEKPSMDLTETHLQRLNSLGFTDDAKSRQLLQSYDSDMDKVIKHYLDIERLKYKMNQKEKKPPVKAESSPALLKSAATSSADELKFEIRVGDLKNLTYTVSIMDANGSLAYKAVLLLHSCIIIKDKNNQTISRIVKDDLHIHPTYSISRSGRKVARCKERFKLSLERKFNYYSFAGEVIKMSGMYGKDWVFKKTGAMVGSLTNKGRKIFELKTKQVHLVQTLSLCMIMLERRYTSMRAVVVV